MDNKDLEEQRQYVWNYFQLHAGQRMSLFNFFIILSALLVTAIVGSFKKDSNDISYSNIVSFSLSIGLCTMSFIFWKLDQRIRYLIKHAEEALKQIEEDWIKVNNKKIENLKLFNLEEKRTDTLTKSSKYTFFNKHMTYSQCFNVVYWAFGLIGILCLIISIFN